MTLTFSLTFSLRLKGKKRNFSNSTSLDTKNQMYGKTSKTRWYCYFIPPLDNEFVQPVAKTKVLPNFMKIGKTLRPIECRYMNFQKTLSTCFGDQDFKDPGLDVTNLIIWIAHLSYENSLIRLLIIPDGLCSNKLGIESVLCGS